MAAAVLVTTSGSPSAAAPVPPSCYEVLNAELGALVIAIDVQASADLERLLVRTGAFWEGTALAPGLYLLDRSADTVERVDRTPAGGEPNGVSWPVDLSANGRFALFASAASDLVPDDTNAEYDLFVRDLELDTTDRVSTGSAGSGLGTTFPSLGRLASISDDGRFAAFASMRQLTADDADQRSDVFVRDRSTGTTTRESIPPGASDVATDAGGPVLSSNGSTLLFTAYQPGVEAAIYVRNRLSSTSALVNEAGENLRTEPAPTLSANGQAVIYASYTGHGLPDTTGTLQLFRRDLGTQALVAVGPTGPGMEGRVWPFGPPVQVSADGSRVAYLGTTTTPSGAGTQDVFVADLVAGTTRQVLAAGHEPGPIGSFAIGEGTSTAVWAGGAALSSGVVGRPRISSVELVAPPPLEPPSPARVRQGSSVDVRVNGYNLDAGQAFSAGTGVTLGGLTANGSRQLTGTLSASAVAALGARSVSVVGAGQCAHTIAGGVEVLDGRPSLTSIVPSALRPGESAVVELVGSNLDAPLQVDLGPGVQVQSVTVVDRQHATVAVTADPAAGETLNDVTLTNGLGLGHTTADGFAIHGTAGEFLPLEPARVIDTRTSGPSGRVGPTPRTIPIAGVAGVPHSGVQSVVLNVTVTEPTAAGWLTVWPSGPQPVASNLNYTAGLTVANSVTVPLDAAGTLLVAASSGSPHVVIDVMGFYSDADGLPGGRLHPTPPVRLFDTREEGGALGPGEVLDLDVTDVSGIPIDGGAMAAVVNLTAVNATAQTFLTAWPGDTDLPLASNLNVGPGQVVPNLAIVPIAADGFISVFNQAGSVDVVVDLVGWFDIGDGLPPSSDAAFTGLPPARVLDTRYAIGAPAARVGPGGTVLLDVTGHGGVPAQGVSAVLLNVTAVFPTASTWLTVYPSTGALPSTSSLNAAPGQVVPNLVLARVGSDGNIRIRNQAGQIDIVADVVGWFSAE